MYSSLDLYGPNVVTAEGSDWARHRKISSPAFSDSLIQLAWEQTHRVVHEMFDDWAQRQGDIVTLNEAEEPMKLLALLVLMGAAFGHAEEWTPEAAPPEGHSMLFRDSVQILLKYFSIWDALPSWVWGSAKTRAALCVGGIGGAGLLGETLKRTGTAYMELGRYLREMLHERELVGNIEIKRDMRDVFTNLIVAMSAEDENARMSVDAVFGNMFVFVLAGHETTAHSLSFALALLALEPDEQDKLYEHTRQVLGDREPSLEDHSKLSRVLAVLYEAIRLFPAVTFMPKENVEDVSFLVNSALSEADMADPAAMERKDCQKRVFIPKGSSIKINVAGLHYNPRYWSDPYAFNPDRFLKSDWPKDAFLGFSAGPRGCLGRKFAEVEAVLALTLIVRQFRITTDTKKFKELPGESKLDRRNRLMNADVRITLTPEGIPKMPLTTTPMTYFSATSRVLLEIDAGAFQARARIRGQIMARADSGSPENDASISVLLEFETHASHEQRGWDVFCGPSWPIPRHYFHIADPAIVSQICAARTLFTRPSYEILDLYGPKILSAGDVWLRHQKVLNPAFSETTIRLAWEQTYKVTDDMFDD
ncbi:hypothetical protein FRB98_002545 [Tulasnella sp. 332]|nr:hypothetical protein FRB98_002545 [Tulasnella sp. 332]